MIRRIQRKRFSRYQARVNEGQILKSKKRTKVDKRGSREAVDVGVCYRFKDVFILPFFWEREKRKCKSSLVEEMRTEQREDGCF